MVALILVREVSDPLTGLVKKMDEAVQKAGTHPRRLGTFLIIGDGNGRAEQLQGMAKKEGLRHVSLCVGAVPPRYEVNSEAEVTVVIYNPDRRGRQSVVANFALRPGELNEERTEAIVAALAKALPKR